MSPGLAHGFSRVFISGHRFSGVGCVPTYFLISRFKGRIGQPYILCTKDIKVKDGIVYMPLYMAAILRLENR